MVLYWKHWWYFCSDTVINSLYAVSAHTDLRTRVTSQDARNFHKACLELSVASIISWKVFLGRHTRLFLGKLENAYLCAHICELNRNWTVTHEPEPIKISVWHPAAGTPWISRFSLLTRHSSSLIWSLKFVISVLALQTLHAQNELLLY